MMATVRTVGRGQLPSETESDDVFISREQQLATIKKALFSSIDKGDLVQVDELLKVISANTSALDIRDANGLNTYAHAITEGFSPVIITLLRYKIPLGDALLRACAVSFEEAAKIIIKHARKLPDEEKRVIIECHSDNGDFHVKLTPLKMAAIRNSFVIVQLLIKAEAEMIQEPKLERLAEATLSEVVQYLDIYRALSSPAYLGLAHTNALSNAFKLTGRLRKIAGRWEAVNKEFYDLANQVENFAASLLDYIATPYELGTLFGQSDDPKIVHPVSQVQTAVDYNQKAFVAHASTQTMMSINFYQSLDVNSTMFKFLSLFSIFGYPFICLVYLIIQPKFLKSFISIPHVKLCMGFGSDLAFLACIAAVCLVNDPRIVNILTAVIFSFCIALGWKHICDIGIFGFRDFIGHGINKIELIIVILTFALTVCGWTDALADIYETRATHRHNERVAMVMNTTVKQESNTTEFERLEQFVSAEWNDPEIIFNVLLAFVVIFGVLRAFTTVLNSYHDMFFIWETTVGAVRDIFKFFIVYAIFHVTFSIGLYYLYIPQARLDESECGDMMECGLAEDVYRSVQDSMLTLWWTFIDPGLGDTAARGDPVTLVNFFHIAMVATFLVVALVMVNTLVAVLSSRFSAVEKNSDTEWKFGRSKMWLRFIRSDIVIPPPFNLLPTLGHFLQLFKKCFSFCFGCTKTKQTQNDKREEETNHENARKVLKSILHRYNTTKIEHVDEEDRVGIDDIRQLKQDFAEVKFNIQTKLNIYTQAIDASWEIIRSIEVSFPIMDFITTQIPVSENVKEDDDKMRNIYEKVKEVEEAVNYKPEVEPVVLFEGPWVVETPPEPYEPKPRMRNATFCDAISRSVRTRVLYSLFDLM